ncbi:hypothetical protein, partial [Klebsiella pneumoniae]|uniref:hypothetical protein n=1 Tax=Klebsiella pneumoniae TaxID=573 RepID=UPI002555C042
KRAYCLKTQPATGETYPKSDLFNKALITLTDSEGKERYISPREASAEGVTLYRQEKITVSQGDRMRFSKSDLERGYVANSIWEVQSVSGDSVTLSDG